ncbi:MAG TPA: phosphotransferase family protein [Streptosporangiaceae bacterium]|nr:phosphotransferase family protein [Streptosporangiaceae bacterium]
MPGGKAQTGAVLPVSRVVAWLASQGINLVSPVRAELISGGRSNLTYGLIGGDGHKVVLRRPPAGGILATAHDMTREWRFISALRSTGVPVAEPLALADSDVLGVPFYVMSYVDGLVLHDAVNAQVMSPAARRTAAASLIDTMVVMHQLDIDAVGLGDIGRREDYIGRQLRRWKRQWDQSSCTDISTVEAAYERLAAAVPAQQQARIVHGDFRLGNMICGTDGQIQAVLDWELATLGDPLADLGWTLSWWIEPGDPVMTVTTPTAPPSVLPGFPSRQWLIGRYQDGLGADLPRIGFYVAFAHWRGACISAGVLTRYESGVMGDDGFDTGALRERIARQAETALMLANEL